MESEVLVQDMNTKPPVSANITQTLVEKVPCQNILPRSDQAPITFVIEGRSDTMIDTKNIQMRMDVKILKVNPNTGAAVDLPAGEKVVPYTGFLYTFWQDVRTDLQFRSLDKTFDFYPLIAFLQLLLYAPRTQKDTVLQNALWFPDAAGSQDAIHADAQINKGEHTRNSSAARSRLMQLQGRILVEPLNVSRPLVENVTLTLQFLPNKPENCLLSTADGNPEYQIQLVDCYLLVPRLQVKPSLLKHVASYPWTKTEVVKYMHPSGVRNFNMRTVYHGPNIPRRAHVILMTETRFDGRYNRNKLNLESMDVSRMLMTVNDVHRPYHNGYETNFADYHYTELYAGLYNELNKSWNPESLDITWEAFRSGYTIWAFDLSPNKSSSANFYAPPQSGSVQLQIHFRTAPANNVIVLVFLEQEHLLSIDRDRNWEDKVALEENGHTVSSW